MVHTYMWNLDPSDYNLSGTLTFYFSILMHQFV